MSKRMPFPLAMQLGRINKIVKDQTYPSYDDGDCDIGYVPFEARVMAHQIQQELNREYLYGDIDQAQRITETPRELYGRGNTEQSLREALETGCVPYPYPYPYT